jgi:hypothetical protein
VRAPSASGAARSIGVREPKLGDACSTMLSLISHDARARVMASAAACARSQHYPGTNRESLDTPPSRIATPAGRAPSPGETDREGGIGAARRKREGTHRPRADVECADRETSCGGRLKAPGGTFVSLCKVARRCVAVKPWQTAMVSTDAPIPYYGGYGFVLPSPFGYCWSKLLRAGEREESSALHMVTSR